MYIDFKITNWERIEIPEHLKDKVLTALKDKKIQTAWDIHEFIHYGEKEELTFECLECSEYMTPKENGGQSTIEAYINEEEVFNNSDKKIN